MSKVITDNQHYKDIAAAIREKTGTDETYLSGEMANAVRSISGGGGSNIVYGETAPEDTSKIWAKCPPQSKISTVAPNINVETSILDDVSLGNYYGFSCGDIVGDYAYIIGGTVVNDKVETRTNIIQRFNVKTETLEVMDITAPEPIICACAKAVGNIIYVFAPSDNVTTSKGTNKIYKYDTVQNTFVLLETEIPNPKFSTNAGCAKVGKYIYIFGGNNGYYGSNDLVFRFNSETEEIEQIAILPTRLYGTDCVAIGTDIYLLGGYVSGTTTSSKIYKFDTLTNEITTITPDTTDGGLSGYAYRYSCSFGNDIYVMGGEGYRSSVLNNIGRYNIVSNKVSIPKNGSTSILLKIVAEKGFIATNNSCFYLLTSIASNENGSIQKVTLSSDAETDCLYLVPSQANKQEIADGIYSSFCNAYISNDAGELIPVEMYKYDTELEMWMRI